MNYEKYKGPQLRLVPKIDQFPSVEEFVKRHGRAVHDEHQAEIQQVSKFNSSNQTYYGHLIQGPSKSARDAGYTFRVDMETWAIRSLFYYLGKPFDVRLTTGRRRSEWHEAIRTSDRIQMTHAWDDFTEIYVSAGASKGKTRDVSRNSEDEKLVQD
ncbi:hypothetical protein VFPPC_15508 [Pochonia chlamydosporia 170]|uniref:Uncharacterized protein n=1 Tax=Pochonia chlamydosporia 170 TaxID=1380566 RepID=A0A179FWC3_METCM|nr:hypothetical protein VFPPC_15508 [Pochonia chlamydosporia 170]OAQ69912.1 hypothetical protein VFPPC_15508 [Pochonia chlamydosporia 170]